jgi:Uma2 family endonuclease
MAGAGRIETVKNAMGGSGRLNPMSISIPRLPRSEIVYPDSDGKPMADNTLQFRWIVTIKEGLDRVYRHRPDVFVAGDLLWYPVEGKPKICAAPDALVAIGRPKGDRGSYKQWEEGGIAPQVVFEVLSPNNRVPEMERKLEFYDLYGVQEYYIYDPDEVEIFGRRRVGGDLKRIRAMSNWTSPILEVRFDMSGPELKLFGPDGDPFLTYQEIADKNDRLAREALEAERQRDEVARKHDIEFQRAERMAAQLRAMGIEPAE